MQQQKSEASVKDPIAFLNCTACDKRMVEPFRLPFCAKDADHFFCISCFKQMFKVKPIRNNCPMCSAKFEPPETDGPVVEAAPVVEKAKKKGKKKKGGAKAKEEVTVIDPTVVKLYMMKLRMSDVDKPMQQKIQQADPKQFFEREIEFAKSNFLM